MWACLWRSDWEPSSTILLNGTTSFAVPWQNEIWNITLLWKDTVNVKVFMFDFCSLLFVFYYFGRGSWIGLVYFFNSRVGSARQWNASWLNQGSKVLKAKPMFTPTFYSPNIYIIHTFFSILKWLLNRATKKVQILLKNVVLQAPSMKRREKAKRSARNCLQ